MIVPNSPLFIITIHYQACREQIEFRDAELERRAALIQQLEVKSSALIVSGTAAVQVCAVINLAYN